MICWLILKKFLAVVKIINLTKSPPKAEGIFLGGGKMAQVRIRKRGKTWSYIFEAGKIDGKRKVLEKGGFETKDAAYNDFLHGNSV